MSIMALTMQLMANQWLMAAGNLAARLSVMAGKQLCYQLASAMQSAQ